MEAVQAKVDPESPRHIAAQEAAARGRERAQSAAELRVELGAIVGWHQGMGEPARGEPVKPCWIKYDVKPPRTVFGRGNNPPALPFPDYTRDINACFKDLLPRIRAAHTKAFFYCVISPKGEWRVGLMRDLTAGEGQLEARGPDLAMALCELAVLAVPQEKN